MTIFTPGCSGSVVRKTSLHSWVLSIAYLSVTFMVPMISPVSSAISAISPPSLIESAVCLEALSVTGIGQNSPDAVFISSQTPFQSALSMNPLSGVNPPMPSMIRSPVSRLVRVTLGSECALFNSSCLAVPVSRSGFSSAEPCGATSFDT